MTGKEIRRIITAISEIAENHVIWQQDYQYDRLTNEWTHISEAAGEWRSLADVQVMFQL
ncbi:hypothetical protein D3C81_2046580 [compost metagenome]